MLKRSLAEKIATAAEKMPIVTVIGPRQSGKTTLVKDVFAHLQYVSLEHPGLRSSALRDPEGFLARFQNGAILDEVQRVPDLLSYIQVAVDMDDRPGRFVLTGSQNFLLMQNISQTLAGRTSIFTLLPFSLSELYGLPEPDPAQLDVPNETSSPKGAMWETVWTGMFPRIYDKQLDPQAWLADYHRTYIERDLREVLRVMDLDGFERFVRLAAARTGQELNYSSLAADAGITQPTAKQWLTTLRASSLVTLLPPHFQNYRKRLRKSHKLHFLDTGLVCYLLGISSPSMLAVHPLRGAIFESFIVAELTKSFVHAGREAPLYHWRDATGHEVDILIDLGERLIPIEVKSAMTLPDDVMNSLKWWTGLRSNANDSGILVHGGNDCFMREGFCVRPWWIG